MRWYSGFVRPHPSTMKLSKDRPPGLVAGLKPTVEEQGHSGKTQKSKCRRPPLRCGMTRCGMTKGKGMSWVLGSGSDGVGYTGGDDDGWFGR